MGIPSFARPVVGTVAYPNALPPDGVYAVSPSYYPVADPHAKNVPPTASSDGMERLDGASYFTQLIQKRRMWKSLLLEMLLHVAFVEVLGQ